MSMRELPDRPNLDQLRHQARDLKHSTDPPITLTEAQLALARQYGFASWPKLKAEVERRRQSSVEDKSRSITIRPVASIDELVRTERVIARQFAPRRSSPADGLAALQCRFREDRNLMLVAKQGNRIVGGALAFRKGDSVKVNVIAIEPEARGIGVGRQLMETIEREAIRLRARTIHLGGANTENRGFYWRLGFQGRRSLMQKGLPIRLSV
jgi:GNAT superfamily N-acetyltransferase